MQWLNTSQITLIKDRLYYCSAHVCANLKVIDHLSIESVSNCENKPITEIALYSVRYAGSLDQFSCLPVKETVNSTLAHQCKHRGKTKNGKVSECMIVSLSVQP